MMDDIEVPSGLSRRDVLKVAGAGAAVAWSTPMITGVVAHAGARQGSGPPGCGQKTSGTVIPFGYDNWEYKFAPDVDFPHEMSGTSTGAAPFGSTGYCFCSGCGVQTIWPGDAPVLLQTTIDICGPVQLDFSAIIDDNVQFYLDGDLVGGTNGCVCAALVGPFSTVAGTGSHRVSVRGVDCASGGSNFIDVQVSASPVP
jgi:hypothetical protein